IPPRPNSRSISYPGIVGTVAGGTDSRVSSAPAKATSLAPNPPTDPGKPAEAESSGSRVEAASGPTPLSDRWGRVRPSSGPGSVGAVRVEFGSDMGGSAGVSNRRLYLGLRSEPAGEWAFSPLLAVPRGRELQQLAASREHHAGKGKSIDVSLPAAVPDQALGLAGGGASTRATASRASGDNWLSRARGAGTKGGGGWAGEAPCGVVQALGGVAESPGFPGVSSDRSLVRDQEVAGSNPVSPTPP